MKMFKGVSSQVALLPLLCLSLLIAPGCHKKPPVSDPTDTGPVVVELSIRSVNPGSGKNSSTTDITINGASFGPGAKVFVGDTPAQNVVVKSETQITATVPAGLAANTYLVVVRNPDGKEASLLRGFTVLAGDVQQASTCEVGTIYFEFDDATLGDAARMDLQNGLSCLKDRGVKRVRIEGHADERGSTDYNLALGQRRADSVRSFLTNLGFPAGMVSTISYGEEKPADMGHDDGAWAKNRRAEIVLVE